MNMMNPAGKTRIIGVDLARAVAIAGMILEHFNQVIGTLPYTGPDWLIWLASRIDGRSAVLFVILAGIGMSLAGQRARVSGNTDERKAVRSVLLKRAGVLFVVGLLFHIAWESDILHYFGVFIALGSLLLFVPARWLWLGVLFLNAGCMVALLGLNGSEMWCYDAGWDWDAFRYVDFWTPIGFIRNLLLNGCFPVFPWFGFLLIGIWLGRLDLSSRRFRMIGMIGGAVVTIAAGIGSQLMSYHIGPNWLGIPVELSEALFGRYPLPPGPFYAIQATATAFFAIALCLEIGERFGTARWLHPWLLLGQYSLSLYIGHLALFIGPLWALGWRNHNLIITLPAGLGAIGLSLLLCTLWNKRFKRGPLEAVLRRISQPHPRL